MDENTITTEYTIDKITYIVTAAASETATDTLHTKIEKLIIRDMLQSAGSVDITVKNA